MSPAPRTLAFLLVCLFFVGLSSGLPLLQVRCNWARKTIQCAAVAVVVVSTSLLGASLSSLTSAGTGTARSQGASLSASECMRTQNVPSRARWVSARAPRNSRETIRDRQRRSWQRRWWWRCGTACGCRCRCRCSWKWGKRRERERDSGFLS